MLPLPRVRRLLKCGQHVYSGNHTTAVRPGLLGIAAARGSGAEGIADQDQRATTAAQLATQGFTIDVPIMVWGWDAYLMMTMRAQFGYTWVPSALQPPVTIAPGDTQPGADSLRSVESAAGSIKVSTNIQDYPPYNPAPQPTPQTPASDDPVGLQSIGNIYLSVPGETYPDGAAIHRQRGEHLKSIWW